MEILGTIEGRDMRYFGTIASDSSVCSGSKTCDLHQLTFRFPGQVGHMTQTLWLCAPHVNPLVPLPERLFARCKPEVTRSPID